MIVTTTKTDQLSDTIVLESSKDLGLLKSVDEQPLSMQAVTEACQKRKK